MGFGGFTADAKTELNNTYKPYFINYGESFTFTENGVTFAVFQNGEFDFYINPRSGVQVGYRSRNVNLSFNSGYNYDAYVQYDDYGAIIQIENIPIYYDYYGRVSRIGSINIYYNHGRLVRLGGLYVHYDNYGYYSYYTGYINRYNRHYVYHPYHNFFIRPYFDFRVVSYKPYRYYYTPKRYMYYRDHSRNAYYGKYAKRRSYNTNDRRRFATAKVPKRQSDRIARTERYVDSKRYATTTRRGNDRNGVSRSNATTRSARNTNAGNVRNTQTTRTNGNAVKSNRENSNVTRRTQKGINNNTRGVRSSTTRQAQPNKSVTRRSAPVKAQQNKNRATVTTNRTKSVQPNKSVTRRSAPVKAQQSRSRATVNKNNTKSVQPKRTVTQNRTIKPKTTQRRGNATAKSRKPVKRESKKAEPGKRKRRG
jgi:hypothetical protein